MLDRVKTKIIGKTHDNGNTKYVKMAVLLKYLSNFWRTLEMPSIIVKLINCEVIYSASGEGKFEITV